MEILRTLGALLEPPTDDAIRQRLQKLADLLDLGPLPSQDVHTDLFAFQLYPYASVYLSHDGMLGGDARDRIAGFWRILELDPPNESDHLTVMLSYLAEVGVRAAASVPDKQNNDPTERWRHLRTTFLHEHLLTWIDPWLHRLDSLAPPFYRAWGNLLRQALEAEVGAVQLPDDAPAFLVATPAIADPRQEGLEAFLDALLAPLRSGLLIQRDDLLRLAQSLGIGIRLAERKFVLKGLLMQDAVGVLEELSAEAEKSSKWHLELGLAPRAIAEHWSNRAGFSARLMADLADDRRAKPE